jgi:hypothetical protein
MTEITVQVEVVCSDCRARLGADWDGSRLTVEPCAKCLKEAESEAFKDGQESADKG